jgi:hypothetical protein
LANLFSVPNYIKAASPQGLRRFMLQAQIKDKTQYLFFDIQFNNGYWFAWYRPNPTTDTDKIQTMNNLGDSNGITQR